MAKHSFEKKLKIVRAYFNREGGYKALSKKYQVTDTNIKNWVEIYENFGEDGLKRSRKNQKYSFQFKAEVVQSYLSSEMSYRDIGNKYGITNESMICNWVKRYEAKGLDGLNEMKVGRPQKLDKKSKKTNKDDEPIAVQSTESSEELKRLQEENLKLRIENAFLKELRRLRLEEETLRKKQQESFTVSEENSN